MELVLANGAAATMNWSMNIHERQLGASTVIGRRLESESLTSFLQEEIRSLTLLLSFTTALGGNPIGNRLVLTPVSSSIPPKGGR